MTFSSDGQVSTNILGLPVTGTYKLSGKQLTITISQMGMSQTMRGAYENGVIRFEDITLRK